MKTFLLIIVLCFYSIISYGQYDYYNIVIGESNDLESEGLRDIEVIGESYYCWGGGVDNGLEFRFFRMFDDEGVILNENRFTYDAGFIWVGAGQTFYKLNNSEGFLLSRPLVDLDGTKGLLMKVGLDLDTLWTREYDLYPPYTYLLTHDELNDGSIVLTGEHGNGPGVRGTFIAKVDPEGELLWTNVIHPPNGAYRNVQISALTSGFVVSGGSNAGGNTEGYIEVLSESGDLLQSLEGNGGIFRGIMIHKLKSNGDLIVSQTIGTEQVPGMNLSWSFFKIRLYTLNPSASQFDGYVDVFDNDDMAGGGLAKILELDDQSIIILGNHHRYIDETLHKRAFISKLNPEYEVEWYTELAYVPCSTCDNTLYDFEIAPDGGYIMVGKFHDDATDPRDKSWLVKVDACGDLEWQGCEEPNGLWESKPEVLEASKLEIWPNPNSGAELNIRIPQEVTVESVVLVDARGRIIPDSMFQIHGSYSDNLESITLNLESLSSGLYSLILTRRDGRVYSEKVVVE